MCRRKRSWPSSASTTCDPLIVYAATTNAGKLAELRAIFAGSPLEIAVWDRYDAPEEGATSYAENAALKARALWAQLREAALPAAVLADDSGIEVTALGDRPGVLSARYGGEGASWKERRARLLAELDATGSADRSARFVCAIAFVSADGVEFAVNGTVAGRVPFEERGAGGFSYDPLFLYPPLGRTFAEIDAAAKNAISHRAIAARALVAALAERGFVPANAQRSIRP